MIAAGFDDYTVMAISGHSSTRMLARYTHPTAERKVGPLKPSARISMGTKWAVPLVKPTAPIHDSKNC